MKKIGDFLYFGLFKGLPYGQCDEDIASYKRNSVRISREEVLAHIDGLEQALTSEPTYDIFSGERFQAGLYSDGPYAFTTDFARYYRQGKVDIPEEYEEYLLAAK